LKSVNAKGFDLRFRVPQGWDAVEAPARAKAAEVLARGTVYANLSIARQDVAPTVRINESVLQAIITVLKSLDGKIDAAAPRLDGILAMKGVMEVVDPVEDEAERSAAEAAAVASFSNVLRGLAEMRHHEGEALGRILSGRLDEISTLSKRADASAARRPEAVKARLAEQVAVLLATSDRFDPDRLHQEAVLIAAKADVREELDRLGAHVTQARHLLSQGTAVGRKLDFLSQELNREANTLCAKSNDVELTNLGLELKGVVEQFREQVQNLE
jgi:uncharacterized protein (TIGR00255 family)